MSPTPQKPKLVHYRFIPASSDIGIPMYRLLTELVDQHHDGIRDARIALAWNLSWKPDVDGRVILGQCKKLSDLERELLDDNGTPFDFVIILRQEFWTDPHVPERARRALLDHELCHAAVTIGKNGEPVIDERGRLVYRLRKHDLEEFACIAERYECWKKDVEDFARALERGRHNHTWPGYTALREELRAVGLVIPLDIIKTWSDHERREARTWATLRLDSPLLVGAMPNHLAAAAAVVSTHPS